MIKLKKILLFIIILISATFLFARAKKLPVKNISISKSDGTIVNVSSEIAKTESERNHGFMERKKIPDGTGMIFIFEKDQILSFWMKNTPHPLSIAYIDSNGKIRDIFDMTPFSLSPVISTVSVRYALEVPQGWYKKNGITPGDTISLDFLK